MNRTAAFFLVDDDVVSGDEWARGRESSLLLDIYTMMMAFIFLFSAKSDFQVNSREDRIVERGGLKVVLFDKHLKHLWLHKETVPKWNASDIELA